MNEIHAKKVDERKFANVLQSDVVVKGKISCAGNMLIKGKIEGSLKAEANVVLAKQAEMQGDLSSQSSLLIQGNITGNLYSPQNVSLEQDAHVKGDICTPKLDIEPGSFF